MGAGAMDDVSEKPAKKRVRRSTAPTDASEASPAPAPRMSRPKGSKASLTDASPGSGKAGSVKRGKGKGAPRRSGRAPQKAAPVGPAAMNWDDYEDLDDAIGSGSGDSQSESGSGSEDEYAEDVEDDVDPYDDVAECALHWLSLCNKIMLDER